jgi:hypothetical protein
VDDAERRVSEYLSSLGLTTRQFDKTERRLGRTPDFRVYDDTRLLFYCEVKSLHYRDEAGLDDGANRLEFVRVPSLRERIYDRLATYVHNAVKQFDAVNAGVLIPNVIAFVNGDSRCRFDDIRTVITDTSFARDDGNSRPDHSDVSQARSRIHDERRRIHLYVWFEDGHAPQLLLNAIGGYRDLLTAAFRML